MERAAQANHEHVFPVSFAQARLWFLDQMDRGSPLYNVPAALRIRDAFDIAVLERCFDAIVGRHEALRTTFRTKDGQPVQVIRASLRIALPVVDLTHLPAADREAEALRVATEEARLPFDLSRGPLLRAKVVKLAEDDHVLLVTFHHIVSDGWSLGVFFHELSLLRDAFGRDLPSPLSELPIQYADFAVWQRETLRGETLARHLEFWRGHLRGAPALVDLPTDRARPPAQTFRGTTHAFRLPLALQEAVQALGRALGATPFMVLLAAYAVLVSRRARTSDVVIGAPIANRTRAELEGLIGFFVNLLALRVDLEGDPSFRDLVGRVRDITLAAYAHQDLPFERLVEDLAPERSLSHGPLVQVTFGLHNMPLGSSGASDDPDFRPPQPIAETAKFDLSLVMMESPSGLLASFDYNTDLFDAATIERMAGELETLLRAATSDPSRAISALDLLSPEERNRLITRWNDTAVPFPEDACLHQLFAAQARRTPEAEALVCGDQSISYRGLAARAGRLAHYLRSLGVGPEVRVGICLSRSSLSVTAILGVLVAGGAYVPLDPSYPRERLSFMMEDAAAPVLLTETALAADLPRTEGRTIICLDALGDTLSSLPEPWPESGVTSRNLAYVMYTSGSTGRPKGVLVEHRGLANLPTAQASTYAVRPGDRVLQTAPLSFDTSVCEIWGTLTAGGTLVVATEDEHLPSPALVALLRRQRVTAMIVPPSVLGALPPEESSSLPIRMLALVGESCPAELVKRWTAPGRRIFNSYGPTEATIWATSAADIDGSRPPPIGFPVANVRVHVLDERREPVPLGVVGEIYIGGVGVARGYHQRPELTAERFVPDPFSADAGARLYRTGDLARRLADGSLEFAGRVDDQIKLRGFRIEIGEIEAVLGEHPAVEAACVVCREPAPGRRELVAYLTEDPGFTVREDQAAELRAELHEEWRTIFDETYREARPAPATVRDTVGWKSSYTGAPLSAEEMADWADASAARILALAPRRVLEVGCGTGLVLHRVAPRVERYVGLDFSAVVVDQLEAEVRASGLSGVHLERRDAADLASFGERDFDVVVLNSVVQYLPSLDALIDVVASALPLLADDGAVVLGDVRSLPHLAAQHASVELFRAPPGASRADVRAAAERKRALEQELVLDPDLFRTLPSRLAGIARVEIHLRRGRHRNEMTKFHYDVVIRKGPPRAATITPVRVEATDLPCLRCALRGAPEALLVTDLPDARLADDLRILQWLEADSAELDAGSLRAEIAAHAALGVDPEDVIALGESLGYTVALAPGDAVGRFDALLLRRGVIGAVADFPRAPAEPPARLANDPVAGRLERAFVQSVRAHLELRLPSYMIPGSFVVLEALPRSPNGKVDRKALAARVLPAPGSDASYRAPRNAVEESLAQVYASVLRLPKVGIHDNFFEIGGDSILSIQIVSRAQELGIALTPRQMFQHQTIAALAAVASTTPAVVAEQGPVTGPAPLTPIQRWWLDQEPAEPHHFNQSLLVEVHAPLDSAALERAVACLVGHHDALRLRLAGSGQGARMIFAEPGGPAPFRCVDLTASPEADAVARVAAEAQASLDLAAGPILRVVHFDRGTASPPLLLLIVHHLAVDAVSWTILLADLWTAYEAAHRGAPIVLPRKTTSFKRWAERLAEHASGSAALAELSLWQDPARRAAAPIPVDHRAGRDDGASARHVVASLSPEETERLLREAPSALRARVDELLVTAFAVALSRWIGSPTVVLDLERHGREDLFPDVDLTRTVGWFTMLVPLAVRVGELAPRDALAAVQHRIAELPHHGLGYGLLRFLRADTREALGALPSPEVAFNYLGQLDAARAEGSPLVPVQGPKGEDRSSVARRTHLVEVNACVTGGALHATFTYGEHRHDRATIERLAASFVDVLRSLLAETRPAIAAPLIEDRYPVSPLQEGILFHARTAPADDNVYLVQTTWTMEGDLDTAAFAAAVQDLVDRHAVLRTAFDWAGSAAPEQIVYAGVAAPVEQRDLRARGPEDQARDVERYAAAERARGFDLDVAPLMRVALLRLRDDAHRFVWTAHHVILDGWSMPTLIEELFVLYEARREHRAPHLEAAPPFRDYIDWLGKQDLARSASFWRRELEGFLAATPLGVDHPARDDGGPRAGVQRLSIDDEATEGLIAFAQRNKLTLSTLVHGAWALLLARYAGDEDVLFGATVSGRSAKVPGVLRMVGLLINTLPVRVRAPLDARVEAWLSELQAHLAELREHEHSPLIEVMAKSDVPRGAPIFESLVVFENYPVPLERSTRGGVPAQRGRLIITDRGHFDDPPYPLTLIAAHRGALHFELGYDRRRIDDDAARCLLGHLATLLASFAARKDATLRELSLLPDVERRRILAAGNDTAAEYPRDACLHDLFEARAATRPEAIALLFEGRAVTYRELAARARAVARRLRALGVGHGARVGLFAERSPEAVAGILGALAAGAAYVPLDPAYPHERLAFMIEDARLDVILADARSAPRAPKSRAVIEPLEVIDSEGEATASGVTSVEPAWVIYTSGSSGQPKGVIGSHRSVVNRCAWMWQRYPFREREVSCHRTTLSFSDSLWEIFGPLLRGVPSLVLPDARVHDLALFLRALHDARVSRLVVVPSLLRALLDVAPDLGARLPDLAIVTTSGEALSDELAVRFHRAMPGRTLLNVYGSTEVSADATWTEVPSDSKDGITIGVPIANTRAHVLDAASQPAPFGVPGELVIGGDALTLGYLDRPDLTAERFVRDAFSEEPSARLFRTGDRARRRASGEIELLGRLDDQVKIRGVRVELGGVRAKLLEHPDVREAAVVARADASGELRLAAYVVARGAAAPEASDLAAFLRDRVPGPEVPSAYVILDAMPHLPNGKLDRRALPAPAAPSGASVHVEPRSAVEQQIASIWAEVLGIDRISVTAGFFELGGHSLLLARVHDRLVTHFGRPLALVDLLAHPTVAALARYLSAPAEEHSEEVEAGDRARRRRRAAARRVKGGERGGSGA